MKIDREKMMRSQMSQTTQNIFYLSGWNDFSKNKKRACNVGTPPPR